MFKAEILLIVLMSLISGSIQDDDTTNGNYDPKTDGVVTLTQENFRSQVLNSGDSWLVIFDLSESRCWPCIQLSATVKRAIPLLQEKKINVGVVDSSTTEGKKLSIAYGIDFFPAMYTFGHDKATPYKYPFTPESAEQLANFAEYLLNKPPAAEGQCGKDTVQSLESNNYELTDENFEEVVLNCEEPWIVNFYTPNYDLCNQFMPHFEAAAKEFKGRAKFGSLYQLGSKVADKYGVTRICTVKLFPTGNKNGQPEDYNNGQHGTTINSNLIPWIKTSLAAVKPAPDINELTTQSDLDAKCRDSGVTSCIFCFLPKSDQCNSECQSTYMDQLKDIANEMKAEHWAWFWTTPGNQPTFEGTFGVQSFPSVVAVDLRSKTFSTKTGTTSATKTKEYLQSYSRGIVPTKDLPPDGLPSVNA